jgi:pimeloyl-ACP methyl ester carboxylesterase
MSDWRSTRIAGSGATLHLRQAGSGPAILLLHGFPDSSHLWDEVAPRLVAAGCRVLAPDLRGFGRSDAPTDVGAYALGHIVADLRALLGRLTPDQPVHVVGHDWGAVAGWCLALEHPQSVRSLVALSVGHPREYAMAGIEQKLKGLYTLAWQVPGLAERWLAQRNFAGLRGWGRQHPHVDACVADMARPGRLTAGLNWYRANLRRVLLGSWDRCTVPTLGVWGTGDHFLAEDQMRRSERQMAATWRYERIEGAGHWLPLELPDRIAELALQWSALHGRGDRAGQGNA